MPAITVESLTKQFDTPDGTITAVNEISLNADQGEFISLLGPSGCGKTTTLRCIAGLETPTTGRIVIDGEDMTEVPANKRNLAMMFQSIALYPHMTIEENIGYPLKVTNVPSQERTQRIEDATEMLQIGDLLKKYPNELSGGQRQRAALSRTIVQEPSAFLMDEPLSDLDAKLKIDVRKEIQRIHKQLGKPTIYVTHDQEEAMTMSDRIAVMNDGEIEQIGAPREIYQNPKNIFVAKFIGNPTMNFLAAETETGRVTARDVDFTAAFQPTDAHVRQDGGPRESRIGIRPQDVQLSQPATEGSFSGRVQLIEFVDDRALAILETDPGEMTAMIPANADIQEGDQVAIDVDTNIYIFDEETTRLIGTGPVS